MSIVAEGEEREGKIWKIRKDNDQEFSRTEEKNLQK